MEKSIQSPSESKYDEQCSTADTEGIVLRHEKHFDSLQLFRDHALNEMVIAENGPLIHHAETQFRKSDKSILRKALENGTSYTTRKISFSILVVQAIQWGS